MEERGEGAFEKSGSGDAAARGGVDVQNNEGGAGEGGARSIVPSLLRCGLVLQRYSASWYARFGRCSRCSRLVLHEVPLLVVERASGARLQPASDAVELDEQPQRHQTVTNTTSESSARPKSISQHGRIPRDPWCMLACLVLLGAAAAGRLTW